MKQIGFYLLAIVFLCSCDQMSGSGNIVTEKRETGDFKGISAGGAFEVEVKIGPDTEVKVEADDNIMQYIETEVRGGVLRIETQDGINFNDAHFKVYVTTPELNRVNSSGASHVVLKDPIRSKGRISLDVSGAGRINGSVDAPEVDAEVSGAAKIELSGKTRNYKARVSGSGDLRTSELKSESTDVEVSGAGNAQVHASVSLKANASGAGNIHYRGGAAVQQNTSGAGNVKKVD